MRLVLLLLAALTFAAPRAWGCSYAPGDAPKYDPVSSFSKSDFVANVKIIKVYQPNDNMWMSGRAVVRTLNTYKGKLPPVFEITYHRGSSACGFDYYTNTETIIFSYNNYSEPEIINFMPHIRDDLKETKELLQKLSYEKKDAPENQKVYKNVVTENFFVTALHPGILGRPKVDNYKSLSEEATLQKVSEIIGTCKKVIKTEATDERIAKNLRGHVRPQIYIAYKDSVEWNVVGQNIAVLSIWMPFYEDGPDNIKFKDKFFEPVIETFDGKTLILEGCEFPELFTFFEPATPPP